MVPRIFKAHDVGASRKDVVFRGPDCSGSGRGRHTFLSDLRCTVLWRPPAGLGQTGWRGSVPIVIGSRSWMGLVVLAVSSGSTSVAISTLSLQGAGEYIRRVIPAEKDHLANHQCSVGTGMDCNHYSLHILTKSNAGVPAVVKLKFPRTDREFLESSRSINKHSPHSSFRSETWRRNCGHSVTPHAR